MESIASEDMAQVYHCMCNLNRLQLEQLVPVGFPVTVIVPKGPWKRSSYPLYCFCTKLPYGWKQGCHIQLKYNTTTLQEVV